MDSNNTLGDLQNDNQRPEPKQTWFRLFWSKSKNRKISIIIGIIIVVLLVLWGLYEIGTKEENNKVKNITSQLPIEPANSTIVPSQTQTNEQAQKPAIKTVNDHSIPTTKISTQNCYAYAPAGWTNVENAAAYAFGYDAYNSDQSLGISYLVTAVTVDPYGNYYHNSTPEEFIETTMTQLQGYSNFSWASEAQKTAAGYTLRMWQANKPNSTSVTAVAQWLTWDLGDGTGSYVIALRMAATDSDKWQNYGAITYNVVASVRCTAQVKQNAGVSSDTSSSMDSYEYKNAVDDRLSELRSEQMLEYENVRDPNTGEHYQADYGAYSQSGPDGPGYYKQVGNGYTKLEKVY